MTKLVDLSRLPLTDAFVLFGAMIKDQEAVVQVSDAAPFRHIEFKFAAGQHIRFTLKNNDLLTAASAQLRIGRSPSTAGLAALSEHGTSIATQLIEDRLKPVQVVTDQMYDILTGVHYGRAVSDCKNRNVVLVWKILKALHGQQLYETYANYFQVVAGVIQQDQRCADEVPA